jgi:hypothetical protein
MVVLTFIVSLFPGCENGSSAYAHGPISKLGCKAGDGLVQGEMNSWRQPANG